MTTQPVSDETPQWTFGDRIRKARRKAGMTQKQFAEVLGVGEKAYAQWETDANKPGDIVAVAQRVQLLTRIPAAWMLGVETAGPGPGEPGPGLPAGSPRRTRTSQPFGYQLAAA